MWRNPTLFQGNHRTTGHGESGDDVGIKGTLCGKTFMKSNYANYEVAERYIEAIKKWNKDNT
jgi:hypothetical protein